MTIKLTTLTIMLIRITTAAATIKTTKIQGQALVYNNCCLNHIYGLIVDKADKEEKNMYGPMSGTEGKGESC